MSNELEAILQAGEERRQHYKIALMGAAQGGSRDAILSTALYEAEKREERLRAALRIALRQVRQEAPSDGTTACEEAVLAALKGEG